MDKTQNYLIRVAVIVLGICFLLLPFGSYATAASKKLVFADVGWDSVQVHNRIAGFILEHGYGYEVEYMPGETIPLFAGLADIIAKTNNLWSPEAEEYLLANA